MHRGRLPREEKGRLVDSAEVTGCQRLPAKLPDARRKERHGTDSSLPTLRRNQLHPHFDLGLLASRTEREDKFLSHPVCGVCYGRPRKLTYLVSFCSTNFLISLWEQL